MIKRRYSNDKEAVQRVEITEKDAGDRLERSMVYLSSFFPNPHQMQLHV